MRQVEFRSWLDYGPLPMGIAGTALSKNVTILTADGRDADYWSNFWRERELLYFLAWRDLIVRYKQTFVGVAWTVLRPLATVLVYTFVFGVLAQLPSKGVPYTLVTLTGLLPWQLFSTVLIVTSESLLANAALVQKIYFPRLIIPVSSLAVCVVDHVISMSLVVLLLAWFRVVPGWQIVLLPFVVVLATACAFGLGLIASALNTRVRDLRQLLPIVLQVGVFLCPVGYATSLVGTKWRALYALNPVVGVIDAFRWSVLGTDDLIYPPSILVSIAFAVVSLTWGIRVFRRMEGVFPDLM